MGEARYARQVLLPGFGERGQQALGAARVVVVGAGGLGCAVLPVLAAAGVGALVVVDDDTVETTNLHRQTLYGPGDVGAATAEVAATRLTALGGRVTAVVDRATPENAAALVAGADLVVDATDDPAARYALDDATAAVPLVWGSAIGLTGQVGVAAPGGPRWRDLFPVPPAPGTLDTCALVGVLPSLCTTVGGAMATEALKLLTGLGRPLVGRVLVFDALASSVREIAYGAADAHQDPDGGTMTDVAEISPAETAQLLESGADVTVLDVREPWEADLASIPGTVLIPLGELPERVGELDPDREVIVHCHSGVRSLRGAAIVQQAGLRARSMAGGIDGWSRTVDPEVPRY